MWLMCVWVALCTTRRTAGACVGRAIGAVRTSGGSSSAGGVARRGSGEHVTICSRRQLKFLKLAALRKDALKAQIAGSALDSTAG
jgi:hypothetical protein